MRLIGRGKIPGSKITDEAFATWFRAWASEVSSASWASSADLFASYPNAESLGGEYFRFPAVSRLRLDVQICFERRLAYILSLTEEDT